MKLTVLGGSAAGPNTGQGCSGYLVADGESRFVLDLGPGTLPELRRHVDFRTLDGIVISHMHLDHVLDLLALRFALAYNPIPAPLPIPLWLPPGGTEILARAGAPFASPGDETTFFASGFAIAEYDPEGSVRFGGSSITFTRTVHPLPCWAMRVASVSAPRRDLIYTADTGPTAGIDVFGEGAVVLLAEATHATVRDQPPGEQPHLTPQEAATLASEIGAETLVLTHMWEESGREHAERDARTVFGGTIAVARPGLEVAW